MPFASKRQLQTCFGKQLVAHAAGQKWTWDCEKFLKETKDPRCLPTTVDSTKKSPKCRNLSPKAKTISPVFRGPRGGYYFYAGDVKIYIPSGTEQVAIEKYGYGGDDKTQKKLSSPRKAVKN